MSFLLEEEYKDLSIKRMIFHVVGKSLEDPILLEEITPLTHTDFFLERVRSALKGNLFRFKAMSATEEHLRQIRLDGKQFSERSKRLAAEFQSRHKGNTSDGVFFVFELGVGEGRPSIFALIKYDNEDVVRYILEEKDGANVPRLERFRESFVRKAEAMQKIALVRLAPGGGGDLVVRDRSNTAHISDYFEGFLMVSRVNSPEDLTGKLIEAFKKTFKDHRAELHEDIQHSGVNRIYEVFRQGRHRFDPDDCEGLIVAVFGAQSPESPLRKTLIRKLKENGVSEETFDIDPGKVQKPRRYRIETAEGVHVLFDDAHRPEIQDCDDGRKKIIVMTAKVTRDDVDIEKTAGSN